MKKINKNWAMNNTMPLFFIGFFIAILDDLFGRYSYIGFGIMLISFYLMYLSKKKQLEFRKEFKKKTGVDLNDVHIHGDGPPGQS